MRDSVIKAYLAAKEWVWSMHVNRDRLVAEIRTGGWSQRRLAQAVTNALIDGGHRPAGWRLAHSVISHLTSVPQRQRSVTPELGEALEDVLRVPRGHLCTPTTRRPSGRRGDR